MIRYAFIVWGMVLTLLLTSGCGLARLGFGSIPSEYSLDGVKRLSPGTASDDSTTWGQSAYRVSAQSHLLLRFEKLDSHVSHIDTTSPNAVEIQVSLTDPSEMDLALTELQLCPVTRSWMMLATWELAHPFMGGERWTAAGGDYEPAGCVVGTQVESSTKTISFDVTQWFKDYPRGRGVNDGLLALSIQPIHIVGDQSGSYSPRISFQEF